MDTQQAYEMMRTYLTRPGAARAVLVRFDGLPDNTCAYETVLGGVTHRCAVGCLLSPAGLSETIEDGKGGCLELREFGGMLPDVYQAGYVVKELEDVDVDFLVGAQVIHDAAKSWMGGKFDVTQLDELAGEFGLTVVVDEPTRAPREELVLA